LRVRRSQSGRGSRPPVFGSRGGNGTATGRSRVSSLPSWIYAWAILLLVGCLLCRLWGIDHIPGLNGDEASTSVLVRDRLAGRDVASPFWTPTHRFIPLYIAPLYLLEYAGLASAWLLRLPGALWGLGLAIGGLWAGRHLFARPGVGLSVGLLIACLPTHMAYARLGFDSTQVGLATLLPLVAVLRGAWGWGVLAAAFALLVHPLCIFLAPIGCFALFFDALPNAQWTPSWRRAAAWGLGLAGVLGAGALKVLVLDGPSASQGLSWETLTWDNVAAFCLAIGNMFSGGYTYVYFAGPPPVWGRALLSALGLCFLLGLLASAWAMRRAIELPMRRRLLAPGCVLGILLYYVVNAHPEIGTERYFLVFTVATLLSLGIGAERLQWSEAWLAAAGCGLCTLLMGGFIFFYFLPIGRTGAEVHQTYRTGPVDPKVAAAQWIRADLQRAGRPVDQPTPVLSDGWWTYWVLRYVGGGPRPLAVRYIPSASARMPAADLVADMPTLRRLADQGAYAVGFTDGPLASLMRQNHGLPICTEHPVLAYGGKEVLHVWGFCPRR
jgi:hypothetical protein